MEEVPILMEHPRPELTREQKVGLSFVIFSGGVAVILGVFYVWHHMKVPFVVNYTGPKLLIGDDAENAAVAAEKKADTDSDGLSDYDEKSIYGTSPYLADTDSDGLSDKTEVTSGGDPLCAEGKTCDSGVSNPDAIMPVTAADTFVGSLTEPTAPAIPDGLSLAGGADTTPKLTAADLAKLRALPIAEIRQVLISSGADQAAITAQSDAEVQKLYDDLLSSLTPTP